MPRLVGVSDRDAGLGAKIAFFFTRRKLAQMTGLETAGMLEPLRMYAHIPRLLNAYGRLEQAEAKLDILSPRHRALAELKSATTVRCEYCIDLGSQIAREWGITDEELLALSNYKADYQNAACFSDDSGGWTPSASPCKAIVGTAILGCAASRCSIASSAGSPVA